MSKLLVVLSPIVNKLLIILSLILFTNNSSYCEDTVEPELVEDNVTPRIQSVLDDGSLNKIEPICIQAVLMLAKLRSDGTHLVDFCNYSDKVIFICRSSGYDIIYGITKKRHDVGCSI